MPVDSISWLIHFFPFVFLSTVQETVPDYYQKLREQESHIDKELDERIEKLKLPTFERFPSLPDEQVAKLNRLLSSASSDTVVYEAFNISLTVKDLESLQPRQWLNDEVRCLTCPCVFSSLILIVLHLAFMCSMARSSIFISSFSRPDPCLCQAAPSSMSWIVFFTRHSLIMAMQESKDGLKM